MRLFVLLSSAAALLFYASVRLVKIKFSKNNFAIFDQRSLIIVNWLTMSANNDRSSIESAQIWHLEKSTGAFPFFLLFFFIQSAKFVTVYLQNKRRSRCHNFRERIGRPVRNLSEFFSLSLSFCSFETNRGFRAANGAFRVVNVFPLSSFVRVWFFFSCSFRTHSKYASKLNGVPRRSGSGGRIGR